MEEKPTIEAFYREHARAVYAFCISLCRDPIWAEDLMQDTFAKATRSLAGYRGGNPRSWLFAIARSVFIDDARKRRPKPSRGGGRRPSSWLKGRRSPSPLLAPAFDPAVLHPRVRHCSRPWFILVEPGINDLTDEQRMCPQVDVLTYLAIHPRYGLAENRGACGGLEYLAPVQRVVLSLRRLGEFHERACVLS